MTYVQGLEMLAFFAVAATGILVMVLFDLGKVHQRRMAFMQAEIDELTRKNNLYSEFQSAVDQLSADLDSNLEN